MTEQELEEIRQAVIREMLDEYKDSAALPLLKTQMEWMSKIAVKTVQRWSSRNREYRNP